MRFIKKSNFTPIPTGPHNERTEAYAQEQRNWLRAHPSELERSMRKFLKDYNIEFEFKKIFYIRSSGGFIKQFYIEDFYLPQKRLIISVGHKPFKSRNSKGQDYKEFMLKREYPNLKIVNWSYNDFQLASTMKELLNYINSIN